MTDDELALVDTWAARDIRYAYRRAEYLGVPEIEAVRGWRLIECREINSPNLMRDVFAWNPPSPMVQR